MHKFIRVSAERFITPDFAKFCADLKSSAALPKLPSSKNILPLVMKNHAREFSEIASGESLEMISRAP